MISKTILITGGCGFLGANIAIKAIKKGYQVIALDNFVRRGSDRNAAILEKYGVKILHGETRLVEDIMDLPKVDAICHLAGQAGIPKSLENPRLDFMVNAVGTLNLLEYSRKNGGIPLIFASTNKVYSDRINEIPLEEKKTRYVYNMETYGKGISECFPMDSSGTHPHSPYGVSKASGDLLCQEWYHAFGVPTVVFRMSCIYGLYQNGVSEQGWTDFFVRQRILGNNKLIFYGNGKQVRDCLFGDDAANAYLMAIENMNEVQGKVFNLGGGKFNTSLIEYVDILNTYTNKPPMEISYGKWRLADHRVYISNTEKVESVMGWKATVSIEEGVKRMVEAYQGDLYKI